MPSENNKILELLSSLNEQMKEINKRLEKLERRNVPKRLLSLDEAAAALDVGRTIMNKIKFDPTIKVYQREKGSDEKIVITSLDAHINNHIKRFPTGGVK